MHLADVREQQQTPRKPSRQRLDNLPMSVGIERVRKDMLERRRARLEQLNYIGANLRSESEAQTRANKAIFEETLSAGGQEAVVRAVLRKCLPTAPRLTGPTLNGSPLYNKRTRLMASIRASPNGWPPAPVFRGRAITFGVGPTVTSPLDVPPVTYQMPHTVKVPLPIRRNASLRPIYSKYSVALPPDDVEAIPEVVQAQSLSVMTARSSRIETELCDTVIADGDGDTAEALTTVQAGSVITAGVDTVFEVGKRSLVSEKPSRGRSIAKAKEAGRQKDSIAKGIVSTPTTKTSVDSTTSKPDADDDATGERPSEEAPVFVHWVDTVTVSSVESDHEEVGDETGSAVQDVGVESEKGSKQPTIDVPEKTPGEDQQGSRVAGASGSIDKQQHEDDQVVADVGSAHDGDSARLDGSESLASEDHVDLLLPDFVCPSSALKSKEVLVKEWLSRCNMSYAKRSLPLL